MNLKYSSEPIGKEYSIEISFMNQITQERLLYQSYVDSYYYMHNFLSFLSNFNT